jgi:hypothetical protein
VQFSGAIPDIFNGPGIHALGLALSGHAGRVEVVGAGGFLSYTAAHGESGGEPERGAKADGLKPPGLTGGGAEAVSWEVPSPVGGSAGIDFRA